MIKLEERLKWIVKDIPDLTKNQYHKNPSKKCVIVKLNALLIWHWITIEGKFGYPIFGLLFSITVFLVTIKDF